MNLNSTQVIFNRLDEMKFSDEIKPVYDLIRKHPDRIRFVKDHNGVRNVLFIATEDSAHNIFEYPYFAAFYDLLNTEGINAVVEYSPEGILETTNRFLKSSNDILYVGVGFVECQVTNEDYFEILYMMEESKCNVLDAMVSLRRFPEWYGKEADYPFYILKESDYLKRMTANEKAYLLDLKQKYLMEMNLATEKNNEKLFNEICEEIRRITAQIKELEKK